MRSILLLCAVISTTACDVTDPNLGTASQAVAGPASVTASSTVDGQVDVSWSAVTSAFKYYVFQSTAGGAFTFIASVLDPSAMPPAPTSHAVTGATPGVTYCYKIKAAFLDGSESDMSDQSCVAVGGTSEITTKTLNISATALASAAWAPQIGPLAMFASAAGILFGGIPMHAGDMVRTIRFQVWGIGQLTVAAKVSDSTMTETVIGSTSVVHSSNSWDTVTLDVTDTAIPDTGGLSMIFSTAASGVAVGNIATSYTE